MSLEKIYDNMLKNNLKRNNSSIKTKKPEINRNIISEQSQVLSDDPLAKFFLKLQNLKKIDIETKLQKETFEQKLILPEIKTESVQKNQYLIETEEEKAEEDPLMKFLLKLQSKLCEKIDKKSKNENELKKLIEVENIDIINQETQKQNISDDYILQLIKADKNSKEKKLIKENEELSMQITNLQYQINRMKAEAGTWGGGDIGGGGQSRTIDESVFKSIVEMVTFVESVSSGWNESSSLVQSNSSTWTVTSIDGGEV